MNLSDHSKFQLVAAAVADGETVAIPLRGVSMETFLHEGRDVVKLGPVADELRCGRIYLFECQGRYVLHRLTKKNGDNLVFRGDNLVSCEHVTSGDVRAQLVGVVRDGKEINAGSLRFGLFSAVSVVHGAARRLVWNLGRGSVRRKIVPWYLALIAILMWAPLNGLGVPLDNFVLGIRADHLLHASVYIPCVFFLASRMGFVHWKALFFSILIGLTTEGVQYLLPYRGFDINDMVANVLGVMLGFMVAVIADRRHPRAKSL